VYGTTDTSAYNIVTGIAAATLTGGFTVPPGQMSSGLSLSAVPAGQLTTLAVPTSFVVVADNGTSAPGYIKFTNTSPAGCDTSASITGVTGDGHCTISVVPFGSSGGVVEGDTPSTQYYTTSCTCDGTESAGVGANLVISSLNCPITGGTVVAPSVVTKPVTCNN